MAAGSQQQLTGIEQIALAMMNINQMSQEMNETIKATKSDR